VDLKKAPVDLARSVFERERKPGGDELPGAATRNVEGTAGGRKRGAEEAKSV